MNWDRISERIIETLGRAGIGPKEPQLHLLAENGQAIGEPIQLTSRIIPKNGEWIGRTVEGKAELFQVVEGFYYLVGGILTYNIQAKRAEKQKQFDFVVVFHSSDGKAEEAQEAIVGSPMPAVGELVHREQKKYRVEERLFICKEAGRLLPVFKAVEQASTV